MLRNYSSKKPAAATNSDNIKVASSNDASGVLQSSEHEENRAVYVLLTEHIKGKIVAYNFSNTEDCASVDEDFLKEAVEFQKECVLEWLDASSVSPRSRKFQMMEYDKIYDDKIASFWLRYGSYIL